jgi:citrate lyase subunit beta/citryl-CoA lyase
MRPRRSCLSVPGSSPRFIAKAKALAPDELFFDLEDSVAPSEKDEARRLVVGALLDGGFKARALAVRVNAVGTRFCYRDIIEIAENAGARVAALILPKVERAEDVAFADALLAMIEAEKALPHKIGLEVQIETALGLENVSRIAAASPRVENLTFGPADMSASLGLPTVSVGQPLPGYAGDHFHYVMARLNAAAKARGLQAIDGPYLQIRDLEGLRAAARRARALGYDGKWALHPEQIEVINEAFTPTQAEYDKAEALLARYREATSSERRGAVMFGDEMIDEASKKMAEQVAARGRAAGLTPSAP